MDDLPVDIWSTLLKSVIRMMNNQITWRINKLSKLLARACLFDFDYTVVLLAHNCIAIVCTNFNVILLSFHNFLTKFEHCALD